jgi:hypothetical protein
MIGAVPEVMLGMVLQSLGTDPAAAGQVQPLQPRTAHRHYLDSTAVLWIRIWIKLKGRIRIRTYQSDKLDPDRHQTERQDPDPYQGDSLDPAPHQIER